MRYVVQWLKDDVIVAERRYDTLKEAKKGAANYLPTHRVRKGANSAAVRDEDGVLYLRVF